MELLLWRMAERSDAALPHFDELYDRLLTWSVSCCLRVSRLPGLLDRKAADRAALFHRQRPPPHAVAVPSPAVTLNRLTGTRAIANRDCDGVF